MTDLVLRPATPADAEALHTLIGAHLDEGHLLPRTLDELRRHAARFVVCDVAGALTACGELAPLSASVAEIRSLVVAGDFRRVGLATRMVDELKRRARAAGFDSLTAFTHDPRFFIRQNFSIVPHLWVPAKVVNTCVPCPLFRNCAQYAMLLPLEAVARVAERRVA
ncbi:MAG TPA: GNAT family N-acetyltransferase [Vicinamibacterales bacterium]|nr:GNAT family N-acetyltransferase [Vicinamibacterales bacterium]